MVAARPSPYRREIKLLLVANVADLSPVEVNQRYKSMADIKPGFRVLKLEIEIGPIHHRLPDRIRAHATIGFIALILYRVMRGRLHAGGTAHLPDKGVTSIHLERIRATHDL
jgi:transposase